MSRAGDLKEEVNAFLKMNKTGSHQKRVYRKKVVIKFIDALSATKKVPLNWRCLNKSHFLEVITYWRKKKLADESIRRYIGELRCFLQVINYDVKGIDNNNLNIKCADGIEKIEYHDDYLQKITDPMVLLLLRLQTEFGLTLSEAFRFSPSLHVREKCVLLPRDMTNNSEDRAINIINENQKEVIELGVSIIDENINLIQQSGYHSLRERYRQQMIKAKLTPSVNYRHVYAKNRLKALISMGHKSKALKIILNEMGVSTRTLRRYVNEQN